MATRYDIYYAGQLLEGEQLQDVRARIAKLFKADDRTLERLFSGKAQLLKRDCDKATALKYKQAMERAGALPLIRTSGGGATDTPTSAPRTPEGQPPEKPMTAAEKIAALAAAAEASDPAHRDSAHRDPVSESSAAVRAEQTAGAAPPEAAGVSLAPAGSDVLREDERPVITTADIDTSGLDLDSAGGRLAPEAPPAPPAPDTSHLEMGAVGDDIPTLPRFETELVPDIDGLELSPSGTDFTDCAATPATTPQLDLSALELAPAGSDVLEEPYRKRPPSEPPSTDHLSIED